MRCHGCPVYVLCVSTSSLCDAALVVQETEDEAVEAGDRAGEILQARLDHLYAQLRAFVRKFLPETAAIAPQLAKELSDYSPPARALEVMQEVLKCEL